MKPNGKKDERLKNYSNLVLVPSSITHELSMVFSAIAYSHFNLKLDTNFSGAVLRLVTGTSAHIETDGFTSDIDPHSSCY